MSDDSRPSLLLIVTGSTLRAEEADRPLAYYLKQQVEQTLEASDGEFEPIEVLVVSDLGWLNEEDLQDLPAISLGGPGVNRLTRHWLEELPLSLAVDEQYYIQMDPDFDEPHVSIWGMDNPNTQIAVSVFLQRFLPRFLRHCSDLEPESPTDLDDE
ncbi:MAG: hypothetical protein ABI353_07330 [Isosphaeraceae bacterium]